MVDVSRRVLLSARNTLVAALVAAPAFAQAPARSGSAPSPREPSQGAPSPREPIPSAPADSGPAGDRPAGPERPVTFREVFGVREFRPLLGNLLLSTIGDELARVALTVLVYQRTSSALLSAITFAISYLPWLVGGPVLSALADRLPRQRVMVATDAGRAVLVALMAVPGMPLPALLALMFVLAMCSPPFESARSALVADVL